MQNKSVSRKIQDIILGLWIFLLITSFSVIFTLHFEPLYYSNIERHDLVEKTGWSAQKIANNYDILIEYNSIFGSEKLEFDGIGMSEEGEIHFEEVKNIFIAIEVIFVLSLVLTIFLGYISFRAKNYKSLLVASILSFSIPIIIIAGIAIDWEGAFILFHNIFFRNDFWIFDQYTDPIIRVLPDTFFMECAIMIVGIIFAAGMVMSIVYRKMRK